MKYLLIGFVITLSGCASAKRDCLEKCDPFRNLFIETTTGDYCLCKSTADETVWIQKK